MNEPRDIIDVYKQIYAVIPEEHNLLKHNLEKYMNNICYKAPELRKSGDSYIELANILENYVLNYTNMEESWIFEIKQIFNGGIK
jgi:hypothetical protein